MKDVNSGEEKKVSDKTQAPGARGISRAGGEPVGVQTNLPICVMNTEGAYIVVQFSLVIG